MMKFMLPPAVLAGIISVASIHTADAQVTVGNVTLYGSWTINSGPMKEDGCNIRQGGGFIDGNNLFLVGCAEKVDAKLYKIPLERNDTAGNKITNVLYDQATALNIAGAVTPTFFDLGFNKGPDAAPAASQYYWFSKYNNNKDTPDGLYYGTYDGSSFSTEGEITGEYLEGLKVNDTFTNYPFEGFFGLDFHPNIASLATNQQFLYGSAPYGLWRVAPNPVGGGYNIQASNIEFLCSIASRYPGGLGFIPSGTNINSLLIPDYSNKKVKLLKLDPSTGYCIDKPTNLPKLATDNPKVDTFVDTDTGKPWGFIFDPETNDFFVSTYGSLGEFYHYSSFPPGQNIQVLLANINTQVSNIQILLDPTRRALRDKVEDEGEGGGLRNAGVNSDEDVQIQSAAEHKDSARNLFDLDDIEEANWDACSLSIFGEDEISELRRGKNENKGDAESKLVRQIGDSIEKYLKTCEDIEIDGDANEFISTKVYTTISSIKNSLPPFDPTSVDLAIELAKFTCSESLQNLSSGENCTGKGKGRKKNDLLKGLGKVIGELFSTDDLKALKRSGLPHLLFAMNSILLAILNEANTLATSSTGIGLADVEGAFDTYTNGCSQPIPPPPTGNIIQEPPLPEVQIADMADIEAAAVDLFLGTGDPDDDSGIANQLDTITSNGSFAQGVINGDPQAAQTVVENIQAVQMSINNALDSPAVQEKYEALSEADKTKFSNTRDTLDDLIGLLKASANI